MGPEVRWQASAPARSSGSDFSMSGEDTVETLLRRLIRRIEESERRYAEALDELHARLGHVSQTSAIAQSLATPEESETLERLRLQLSGLARRLEQPEPERAQPLDKAREEVRAVSAGLAAAEPDWFQSRSFAGTRVADTERTSYLSGDEPSYASPAFDFPTVGESDADFDRRLIEMAQRLERSIGEAMPSTAIDTLNARMEEIASRFEAALAQTPKLENLQHLERQVADIGQQLGRVEQDIARIGAVEGQLQRLIARIEEAPAQMERAAERGASKAAQETARLVSEANAGKPSAVERLEALHHDIVAMNERSLATDDRLVDTLAAMHESVKGLVQQRERERARVAPVPRPAPMMEASPAEEPASVAPREPAEAPQAPEPPRRSAAFIRDLPFESTEDLVAAARRAAQAAAARAAQRDTSRRQPSAVAEGTKRSAVEPGHHKMSLLMVVAAVLLMISAALLFTRLKSKPDLEAPPPAAEHSIPAPAAEAPPLPELPYQPDVTPNPGAEPAPAADTLPNRPQNITPAPSGMESPPPVRLGAETEGGRMLAPGVSVMVTELN
jgi:localization factor PodJL